MVSPHIPYKNCLAPPESILEPILFTSWRTLSIDYTQLSSLVNCSAELINCDLKLALVTYILQRICFLATRSLHTAKYTGWWTSSPLHSFDPWAYLELGFAASFYSAWLALLALPSYIPWTRCSRLLVKPCHAIVYANPCCWICRYNSSETTISNASSTHVAIYPYIYLDSFIRRNRDHIHTI